jgi:hypothetical protein
LETAVEDASLREVSRGLLGNQHKLDVVAVIPDMVEQGTDTFYSRQVSKQVPEAADNQVSKIISQLHEAGLLLPAEGEEERLRKRYRVRSSSYWSACRTIREELRAARWTPEGRLRGDR